MSPAPSAETAKHQVALVDECQQGMHALQLGGRERRSPWSGLWFAAALVLLGFGVRDDFAHPADFAALVALLVLAGGWSWLTRRDDDVRIVGGHSRRPRDGHSDRFDSWALFLCCPVLAIAGQHGWWICFPLAIAAAFYGPWQEARWREDYRRAPVPVSREGRAMASEALADDDTLRVIAALSLVDNTDRTAVARATGLTPEALDAAITHAVGAELLRVTRPNRLHSGRLRLTDTGRATLQWHLRRLDQIVDGREPAAEASPV